jgi:hypothetical protein
VTSVAEMRALLNAEQGRLVEIEWWDSEQPCTGWTWEEDVVKREATICRSVGWIVYVLDTTVALAANKSVPVPGEPKVQFMGITRIPIACVRALRTLPI